MLSKNYLEFEGLSPKWNHSSSKKVDQYNVDMYDTAVFLVVMIFCSVY